MGRYRWPGGPSVRELTDLPGFAPGPHVVYLRLVRRRASHSASELPRADGSPPTHALGHSHQGHVLLGGGVSRHRAGQWVQVMPR